VQGWHLAYGFWGAGVNEQRLLESIRLHEGYRAEPYRDHLSNWTIGYGHLLEDESLRQFMPLGTVGGLLSKLTARETHDAWLVEDVTTALQDAERWLGFAFANLTDARQEVIVEMSFQLGFTRLSGFVKLRSAIMDEEWEQARVEMLDSLWARQTPERAHSLADKFRAG
jgi:lysozyme